MKSSQRAARASEAAGLEQGQNLRTGRCRTKTIPSRAGRCRSLEFPRLDPLTPVDTRSVSVPTG
jgi:hypothetical protein